MKQHEPDAGPRLMCHRCRDYRYATASTVGEDGSRRVTSVCRKCGETTVFVEKSLDEFVPEADAARDARVRAVLHGDMARFLAALVEGIIANAK